VIRLRRLRLTVARERRQQPPPPAVSHRTRGELFD
jgi:hypothetical protein